MKTFSLQILIITGVVAFLAGTVVSYICITPSKQSAVHRGNIVDPTDGKVFRPEW